MRFSALVLAGLLFVTPALAQGSPPSNTNNSGHVFGSVTCPEKVPCPDDDVVVSSQNLANAGGNCVSYGFGYPSPSDGFFDSSQGLDSNGCLTALPNVIPKGVGGQLSPACCVVRLPTNTCVFHCDLITPGK